jgi:hypothetical protein
MVHRFKTTEKGKEQKIGMARATHRLMSFNAGSITITIVFLLCYDKTNTSTREKAR